MKHFDTGALFSVPLISGTHQTISVRWPSDKQWAEKAAKVRLIERDLGRGKTDTEVVGSEDANLALYEAIRADGAPDLDGYEARAVIDQLDASEVLDITREGDAYTVTLKAHGAETTHTLRTPTQRQMHEFNRARMTSTPTKRAREIRFRLEPAGALYDAISAGVEGYAGAVPLPHKFAVVSELLEDIDRTLAGSADPEI